MIEFNKMNKIIFYYFVVTLLIGTSILSIRVLHVFSASGDPPTISIDPISKSFNTQDIVVTGKYSNTDPDVPKSNLVFTADEKPNESGQSTPLSGDWIISDTDINGNGTWSFTTTITEGPHILTVYIKNSSNPDIINSKSVNITIGPIPYITNAQIFADNVWKDAEDVTKVDPNAQIKITVVDNKPIADLVDRINNHGYNPFTIVSGASTVSGTAHAEDKSIPESDYRYEITFNPTQQQLFNLSSTFLVFIDPALSDSDNNMIIPRFFKFTTKAHEGTPDPHGKFQTNTNTCAVCHSSHTASSTFANTNLERTDTNATESYCMACHDGTTAAPMADTIKTSIFAHNYSKEKNDHLKQSDTCTSCHDPHSGWSDNNPNMLKSHYVYTHVGGTMNGQAIDSDIQQCEVCHTDDSDQKIGEARATPDVNKVYSYKKAGSTSSTGISEDYSLCLRCHSNIKSFYDDSDSKHRLESTEQNAYLLGHNSNETAVDGNLPCAECHETHGSNNFMMLKENLGHTKQSDENKLFKNQTENWTPALERTFCLSCHNNATNIYGNTSLFLTEKDNIPIQGHQSSDTDKACSDCHYDSTKTFNTFREQSSSAAHAPHLGHDPLANLIR